MNSTEPPTERSEILRLIERDLDATTGFVARLITMREALRAVSLSLAGVLAGLAVTAGEGAVALAASAVVILFGFQDAYLSFMYSDARLRARRIERLIQLHTRRSIEHGAALEQIEAQITSEIDRYVYGVNRNLRQPSISDLVGGFWRPPYLFLAVPLALAGLGIGLIARGGSFSDPGGTRAPLVDEASVGVGDADGQEGHWVVTDQASFGADRASNRERDEARRSLWVQVHDRSRSSIPSF